MNPYKLKGIVELVRAEGLLVDMVERNITPDNIITSMGLDAQLSRCEQVLVKQELGVIMEADAFVERLRLTAQQRA